MEPLKEMFNKKFYQRLAREFEHVDKNFNGPKFIKDVTVNLTDLSLNQRMRNTSIVLQKHLPQNYAKAVEIMTQVIPVLQTGYTTLVFPDFTGLFGKDNFTLSMEALKFFTQYGSSEFAIREFLKHDFDKTIQVMYKWSGDKNYHVRRLASEGSRPRLPWSFKLDEVIRHPQVTVPILENLKEDAELYVRKSVANHLNDFSKDSPEHVLKLVNGWDKTNAHTAWIIKRGCRSLIKKGDKNSLAVFNYTDKIGVRIEHFKLNAATLRLNESLGFEFDLVSTKSVNQNIIIHYCIHYVKKSGGLFPKIFSLKETILKPGEHIMIMKKQRFQDFTTRKHFSGDHAIDIIINGKVVHSASFKFKR